VRTIAEPSINFEAEHLDASQPRDQLIASVIDFQQVHALEHVVLFTDDPATRDMAERAGIDVLSRRSLPSDQRLASSSGDGMAPREPASSRDAGSTSRALPFDRLVVPSPLYAGRTDVSLSQSAPVAQAPGHPHAANPVAVAESADLDTAPDHAGALLPLHTELPEAIVQVRLPNPLPASREDVPGTEERVEPPRPTLEATVRPTEPSRSHPTGAANGPAEPPSALRLAFDNGATRSTITVQAPRWPSIEEITAELSRVRRDYPKRAFLTPSNVPEAGPTRGPAQIERKNKRVARYNAALDSYYAALERYIQDISEHVNLKRRSATVQIRLVNDSPATLKSLYITIRLPESVRVFTEESLPKPPTSPVPPAEPNLDAVFEPFLLPRVPVPAELLQESSVVLRNRSLSPLEIRQNNGWYVIYTVRELERHHTVSFHPLYLSFQSFDEAASIRIPYRITVASLSQEERGQLEVLVKKVIQ
jgi:hypothetical protein